MKLLLIADEKDPFLWDYYRPGVLKGYDMILSAGDLNYNYLEFLVTMANRPLLYVHGNHDASYDTKPPEGCDCIDDKLVIVNGLRILGLGGCRYYSGGPYQYTDRQMRRRIRRLRLRLWMAGGVDIVLTHAPPEGYGDLDNAAHRGFGCFVDLIERWKPRYLIHGHVHQRYQSSRQRVFQCGETTVINACGRYELEIEPAENPRRFRRP